MVLAYVVLEPRYVDAIDALRGVSEALSLIHIVLPLAQPHVFMWRDGKAKAVPMVALHVALVVTTGGRGIGALAFGQEMATEAALIHDAIGHTPTAQDGVVLPRGHDATP